MGSIVSTTYQAIRRRRARLGYTAAMSSEPAVAESLGLFPLHTVLLPGGSLSLRVFERRYLDLVRECGRLGRGFGVCLIMQGEEVGEPASAAAYGTEALIEDFGTGEDGLLTLRVRGARRFRFDARTERGVTPLARNHPLVEQLASTVLGQALDTPDEAAAKRVGVIRTSRRNWAAPVSSTKPMPPWTWIPVSATRTPTSVPCALAMGVSSAARAAHSASPVARAMSSAAAQDRQIARAANTSARAVASIRRTSAWRTIAPIW